MSRKSIAICFLTIISVFISLSNTQAQDNVAVVFLGEGQDTIKPILERDIMQILPDTKMQFIDYNNPQTKQVIQQYNLRFLPFVVLAQGIVNAPNFLALVREGIIEKAGNLFYISPQRLKSYGFYLTGSKKVANKLEMFTMSFCPRGQQALRELINLIKNEKLDIPLVVHYITTFREYGIDSVYGPEGIKEDIRQLIIQRDYADKFFDYILARQVMSLEDAFTASGIDPKTIEEKEQDGLVMLGQDAELAAVYGINSSPAFLWEGQHLYFNWQSFRPVILELTAQQKEEKEEVEQEKPKKKNGWWPFGK